MPPPSAFASSSLSRAFRLLAVLGAAVALGAACGGGGENPTPTATRTPAVEINPTNTPEPTPTVRWPRQGRAVVTTEDLNVRVGPGPEYLVLGRLQPDDEVPVAGRGTNGRWLALPGIGWVAYDQTWLRLDVELESLPLISVQEAGYEFVGPLHPLDVTVDIPVVDVVVNAVVQGNRTALRSLVAVPEDSEDGEGGEDEGATDTSPPSHACPADIHPASELPERLDEFLTSSAGAEGPLHLYAVIGAPGEEGQGDDDGRDPEFSIVFAFQDGEGRQVWLDSRGAGITWFNLGCEGATPGDLLRLDRGELFFWYRPVAPEPLDPVQ